MRSATAVGSESSVDLQTPPVADEIAAFLRQAWRFVAIGLLIYGALYGISEYLVLTRTVRNPFFMIRSAPPARYDHVVLGASHAVAFGYGDLNSRLEQLVGGRVMNLSVVGGGVLVNRLLLDYFLTRHATDNVVYVIDSFAFYSKAWNEERLNDRRLFVRAPLDASLSALLLRTPATRSIAVDYVSGFSKINNQDRLSDDISTEERTRYTKTYRSVPQIDRQRVDYLYPEGRVSATAALYIDELESLIVHARDHGAVVTVIKPPIPARILKMLPGEEQFDALLTPMLSRQCVAFYDFSDVGNDDKFFYDSDHLNRNGVLNFFQSFLKDALVASGNRPANCGSNR
jgi:hypothetical protein